MLSLKKLSYIRCNPAQRFSFNMLFVKPTLLLNHRLPRDAQAMHPIEHPAYEIRACCITLAIPCETAILEHRYNLLQTAINANHLDCVRAIHQQTGVQFNAQAIIQVIRPVRHRFTAECLEYIFSVSGPYDLRNSRVVWPHPQILYEPAVLVGNVSCVSTLIRNGVPLSRYELSTAVINANAPMIRLLLQNGLDDSAVLREMPVQAGLSCVEGVRLLLDAGMPLTSDTLRSAYENNNLDLYAYLLDIGCPQPPESPTRNIRPIPISAFRMLNMELLRKTRNIT